MIGDLHGGSKLCESVGHVIDVESDITGGSVRFVETQVWELVNAEERRVLPQALEKKEEPVQVSRVLPAEEETDGI